MTIGGTLSRAGYLLLVKPAFRSFQGYASEQVVKSLFKIHAHW
jgi:hypothetical protein